MTSERAARDEYSIEVAQMGAADRLTVAIKRLAARDAEIERLRAALNNSQSLLVAMLLEGRPESEIEAQVGENREALGPID